MTDDALTNPYVGLRPFFEEDSLYFFGRDVQVAELLDTLQQTRFLPVVGSSGSGKSSLILAGLIPGLRGGFLVSDRDAWRIATMRPGAAPLRNLAVALRRAVDAPQDAEADDALTEQLRDGHDAAAAAFILKHLKPNENLLILADQFEEIFKFRGTDVDETEAVQDPAQQHEKLRRREEAAAFADLLLKLAAPERHDLPLYVVLTMRTDFLGDCDVFYGLPEAMNHSQYLVPRLTRQQLREAIQGPPMLARVKVAPRLLDQLLNELGDRSDRLPLLQHALMRAWGCWADAGALGPIDQPHFLAAGGLNSALSDDAKAALKEATTGPDAVTEHAVMRIFQRLTDTDLGRRRVRFPARRSELMAVTGLSSDAVDHVVARFNGKGRHFLFLASDGWPDDPRVNISHESLIRQWDQLRTWVDKERQARDRCKELVRWGKFHAGGTKALLQRQELPVYLAWKDSAQPTATWAERYAISKGEFDTAMEYLEASIQEDAKEVVRRRARRRNARIVFCAMVVLLIWAVREEFNAGRAKQAAEYVTKRSVAKDYLSSDPMTAALLVNELPDSMVQEFSELSWVRQLAETPVPRMHFARAADAALNDVGGMIAIASDSGMIYVRPADGTGRRRIVRGDTSPVVMLRLVANGTRVVSRSKDGAIRVWNPADSTAIELRHRSDSIAVQWMDANDAGTHVLAVTDDDRLFVWSIENDQSWRLVDTLSDIVDAEIGHRKGSTIVVYNDSLGVGTFTVGRAANGLTWLPETTGEPPTRMVWSDDETLVLRIAESGVYVHRADGKGRPVSFKPKRDVRNTVPGSVGSGGDRTGGVNLNEDHNSDYISAAFSHKGDRLVIGSADGTVRTWNTTTGASIATIGVHEKSVNIVTFGPGDSTVLSASEDKTARIWRADSGLVTVLRGHQAPFTNAEYSADGMSILTTDNDNVARVWRGPYSSGPRALDTPPGQPVALAANGTAMLTIDSKTSTVWLAELVNKRRRFSFERKSACAADRQLIYLATCMGDSVVVSNMRGERRPVVLRGRKAQSDQIYFTDDGKTIITMEGDSAIRFWNAENETSARVDLHGRRLLAMNRDGSTIVITAARGGTAELWTGSSHEMITRLYAKSRPGAASIDLNAAPMGFMPVDPLGAAFSPDGSRLVTWEQGSVHTWRIDRLASGVNTISSIRLEKEEGGPSTRVVFSPNSTRMIVIGERTANVWSADSGGAALRLLGHSRSVSSAAWSADGKHIVTWSEDSTARVWAVPAKLPTSAATKGAASLSTSLELRAGKVFAAAFPPDSSGVVTLSANGPDRGQLFSWLFRPDSVLARMRSSTNACLSLEFRTGILHEAEDQANENRDKCQRKYGRPTSKKR